ncbi:DUF5309 domain-containing protein [Phyllobacterium sp. LjRoot231]|uniref:DUF5309 domain-containing protein n=1 Tax=Phyllobacterium sp. LjRoot231 TaxID=3342289 RepID=UPI003ECD8DC3
MAQVTGTFSTYDAIGDREDLENAIYQITPEETPFISMIGSGKVKAVRHDWQTDALAVPAVNAAIEGDDYTYANVTPTTRLANYTQISLKTVIVTETQDAVDKAGREKELAYQMAKKGVELKKDIEAAALSNVASVAGNDTTARISGGFPAWMTSNDDRGAAGADGGFSTGTGLVVAATNGTQRAFTKTLLDTVIGLVYASGGNPDTVMLSPYNKQVFSTFMSNANVAPFRNEVKSPKQGTIIAAADAYLSDFGLLSVVPNRVMGTTAALARNVFVITPDMVERGVLRPITQDVPAKTGDANKRVIKTEWTLVVKNQAAHGVVADVFGLTATT